jgi:N-acetylneuraminic acid mutarotase
MITQRRELLRAAAGGLVLSLVTGWRAHAQNVGGGKWTQVKPIPVGANEVIGANVNGRFVAYGGLSNFIAQGLFFSYDVDKDEWTTLPVPPEPVHHGACIGYQDKFFVFGGFRKPDDGSGVWMPVNTTSMFDFASMKWEKRAPMPSTRGALAAVVAGTKAYVIGGSAMPSWERTIKGFTPAFGGEQSTANEVYDVVEDKWHRANPMLTGRNHHAIGLINDKIYVVGGRVGSAFVGGSTNISANEEYDIAKDTWRPRWLMPTPRSGCMGAVLGNKLHVIGGEYIQGGSMGVFRAHEVYDPVSNSWALAPNMLTARHAFAIATINGKIYTATGMTAPGTGGGPATGAAVTEVFSW